MARRRLRKLLQGMAMRKKMPFLGMEMRKKMLLLAMANKAGEKKEK
jgi:hypothetical protein